MSSNAGTLLFDGSNGTSAEISSSSKSFELDCAEAATTPIEKCGLETTGSETSWLEVQDGVAGSATKAETELALGKSDKVDEETSKSVNRPTEDAAVA